MYRPAECFTTRYEVLSSFSTTENKNTKVDTSQSLVNMYHTHTRDRVRGWGGGREVGWGVFSELLSLKPQCQLWPAVLMHLCNVAIQSWETLPKKALTIHLVTDKVQKLD